MLVGFNNLTYFCKVFKNITGTTPSSFQKNLGLFKQ
ncbi:AraC family transcriptional regulator [Paucilactobacillus hokkaidonensis]